MASWRKLCVFAALLPGLAAAADQAMLELVMPDARVVMEINLDHIMASPIGQAMASQMKAQMDTVHAEWQQPLAGFTGIDWSHYAQEILFASTGTQGKDSPTLVIVRGLLDPAWVESLNAFGGPKSSYMGVPLLSATTGNAVVAFLDGSIAVAGPAADVKAAIRRRGQNGPQAAVLAEGLQRFEGQYDMWLVSAGGISAGAKSQGAAPALKWLEKVDAFAGGMRMSPDFELNADLTMRTEKDVAEMADGLKWLSFVGQTQNRAAGLDNMKMQVDGKHLSFSLQVPEQQIVAALKQRQPGQRPQAARVQAVRPPEIKNGLPEVPAGSIRVQSSPSDMGTVLVPLGKTP